MTLALEQMRAESEEEVVEEDESRVYDYCSTEESKSEDKKGSEEKANMDECKKENIDRKWGLE